MSKQLSINNETPDQRVARLHAIRVANGKKRAAMPDFKEAQRRGGRTRKSQPDYILACRKGWQTTIARYPEYAAWLEKKIGRYNDAKGALLGISGSEYRRQRIAVNGSEGMSFDLIAW
jgi:hypothetical protein